MPVRLVRIVALTLSVVFLLAACGGGGSGGDSGGSSNAALEKWIPSEVDGQKLEKKEVTIPKEGETTTTTAPPEEGDEADKSNVSQLGQSLAGSIPKVDAIAVGEIASSGENAFGQDMPALFVGAVQSDDVKAIQESLAGSAAGANQTTQDVDGVEVTVIEFDMAAQLQGQELPEGTPALPTITIEYFSPVDNLVVVVFSTMSRELADAATKASIASGK